MNWLENALDLGLTEREFWRMTLAELRRYFESRRRVIHSEHKERSVFEYTQAKVIGACFAACYSKNIKVPKLEDAYEFIYNTPEEKQAQAEREAERIAANFRRYVDAQNKRIKQNKGGAE